MIANTLNRMVTTALNFAADTELTENSENKRQAILFQGTPEVSRRVKIYKMLYKYKILYSDAYERRALCG